MSGTPRCCNTLRSTPLGNLDPVIRLFEGIFLTASANLIRNREFHVDYLGHAHAVKRCWFFSGCNPRGGRGSADHFPTEAESDVGHVPLVVSSRLGACASSDSRSGAAKSILSSVEGLPGPGSPYSRSSMVFLSMYQCEIQTRQVSGQEPDFSKTTNLAGEWLLLVFLNNQTTGTGVPRDGNSRCHSGSAHPGW